MPLETLFISGPQRGGKTTVASMVAREVLGQPAHLIRLRPASDGYTNVVVPGDPAELGADAGCWVSFHLVRYTPDRVFETLPEGLRAVRNIEPSGFTIVEADGDPALRHAYPFDYRLFVMAPPRSLDEVFRDTRASVAALREIMHDTAAFASEIFGVKPGGLDDTGTAMPANHPEADLRESAMNSMEISGIQLRQFLNSPLGAEIVSRVQLQSEYYALVESDVAIINTGMRSGGAVLDACVKRIEKLLARVRQDARRQSVLYWGDITDTSDPTRQRLIRRMRGLLRR